MKKYKYLIIAGAIIFFPGIVRAETLTIDSQAYYFKNNATTTCGSSIIEKETLSANPPYGYSSPWMIGADFLSSDVYVKSGQASGSVKLYFRGHAINQPVLYSDRILESYARVRLCSDDYSNCTSLSNLSITNFSFTNAVLNESGALATVKFDYTGIVSASGTYNLVIGLVAPCDSTGLFWQYKDVDDGEWYVDNTINSSITSNLSKISYVNGSLSDQKLDDLKDNQDKNTEEIKDSINENFQSCRDSKNLYNFKDTNNVTNGVTVDDDGWITITKDSSTTGTYFNYFTNNLDLKYNTSYSIVLEIKNVIGTGSLYLTSIGNSNVGQFANSNFQFTDLTSNSIKIVTKVTGTSFSGNLGLRTYAQFLSGQEGSITFRISVLEDTTVSANTFKYEAYGEQVCTNRIDDTNEKLDDLNGSINNSDVDSSKGNSFFSNFSTEDNGGISSIVTAPLVLIRSLLDSQNSCSDLKFEILGKEVSIPSGCIIWDKVPNEIELIIQTLVCGPGAYYLLKKLFKDINKLKNPGNSEVSTLDL